MAGFPSCCVASTRKVRAPAPSPGFLTTTAPYCRAFPLLNCVPGDRSMGHRKIVIATLAALLVVPRIAAAALIGPTPYLSSADSPFDGQSFSWFYMEDFEDGLLNTPGVTVSPFTAAIAVDGYTDSVDGDDGAIDGSGSDGHSLWSNFASSYFQFDFDAGTLDALPTHVGLVWTDVG